MKQAVFVGVGANINPEENVVKALELLMPRVSVTAVSGFYWSEAVGKDGQRLGCSLYLNGVFQFVSDLSARSIKYDIIRPVEKLLGRVRSSNRFADRPLDLDILLWGDTVLNEPELHIPDKDIWKRSFVAVPLLELAGNICLPGSDDLLGDVVDNLDTTGLRKNRPVTRQLIDRLTGKET